MSSSTMDMSPGADRYRTPGPREALPHRRPDHAAYIRAQARMDAPTDAGTGGKFIIRPRPASRGRRRTAQRRISVHLLWPGAADARPSAPDGVEIAQVRRSLIPAGGHQIAVGTHKIVLLSDDNVNIVFVAIVFVPDRIFDAAIALADGPRPHEC